MDVLKFIEQEIGSAHDNPNIDNNVIAELFEKLYEQRSGAGSAVKTPYYATNNREGNYIYIQYSERFPTLDELEFEAVKEAISITKTVTEAAKLLNVSERKIYRVMSDKNTSVTEFRDVHEQCISKVA